jgi:hypothetical protein
LISRIALLAPNVRAQRAVAGRRVNHPTSNTEHWKRNNLTSNQQLGDRFAAARRSAATVSSVPLFPCYSLLSEAPSGPYSGLDSRAALTLRDPLSLPPWR